MKAWLFLIVLFASCGPAIAQTSECRSITKASDRLACYDKATPAISRNKAMTAPNAISPERDGPIDALAAENARLDAKINNICKGC
jgi:hypothetical protein